MTKEKYVLITPVRNEGDYIERTIKSVITQTIKPLKWIIVSDGSTDDTDGIVQKYLTDYKFIELIKTGDNTTRNFASKVTAFNVGYEQVRDLEYDFIGNLDGDVSFQPDYFKEILDRFDKNEKLGIAGGIKYDYEKGKYRKIYSARNSVCGAYQLFRRECFENVGGYKPLKYGGVDSFVETMARMHGWEVRSYTDLVLYHHKPTGGGTNNVIKRRFRAGIKFYMIGYHPIFPIIRFLSRVYQKPYIIGSLVSISGFLWANLRKFKRPVSDEFVKYLRTEQSNRIKTFFSKGKDPAFKV